MIAGPNFTSISRRAKSSIVCYVRRHLILEIMAKHRRLIMQQRPAWKCSTVGLDILSLPRWTFVIQSLRPLFTGEQNFQRFCWATLVALYSHDRCGRRRNVIAVRTAILMFLARTYHFSSSTSVMSLLFTFDGSWNNHSYGYKDGLGTTTGKSPPSSFCQVQNTMLSIIFLSLSSKCLVRRLLRKSFTKSG